MKRFIAVSFLVLALPFLVSIDNKQAVNSSATMVAYAGRTIMGNNYCTCGDSDCIVDPGECFVQDHNSVSVASGGDSSTTKGSMDSPSSVMLIAVALIMLLRFSVR